MSWLNPPPVVVVAGSEDFLRRRELQKAVLGTARNGRQLEHVQGQDKQHLSRVLAQANPLFKTKILAIIHNADKVDPATVIRHHERGSNRVSLVLDHEGDLKKKGSVAKVVDKLPPKLVINFPEPKPWDRDSIAAKFVLKEAKAFKIDIPEKIAQALVSAAGNDLGVLYFETKKLAALMSFEGVREVSAAHLRQTLSTLSQVGGTAIIEALAIAHAKRLVRAMASTKSTHLGDPTMKVTALLAYNVSQWLHAAALLKQGADEDEIALRIKVHPYVCKSKVLPPAKKWGEESLVRVLISIAAVERGVRSGHVSPWLELEASLLQAIRRLRRDGSR